MLSEINKKFILSLLTSKGAGKFLNIIRYKLTFPNSKYVLGGGIVITHRCNLSCSFCRDTTKIDLNQ